MGEAGRLKPGTELPKPEAVFPRYVALRARWSEARASTPAEVTKHALVWKKIVAP